MVCIRPDIAHAVGVVIQLMSNPRREYSEGVKWLSCYFNCTNEAALCFIRKRDTFGRFFYIDLRGFMDLGKNTTEYVFIIGG